MKLILMTIMMLSLGLLTACGGSSGALVKAQKKKMILIVFHPLLMRVQLKIVVLL